MASRSRKESFFRSRSKVRKCHKNILTLSSPLNQADHCSGFKEQWRSFSHLVYTLFVLKNMRCFCGFFTSQLKHGPSTSYPNMLANFSLFLSLSVLYQEIGSPGISFFCEVLPNCSEISPKFSTQPTQKGILMQIFGDQSQIQILCVSGPTISCWLKIQNALSCMGNEFFTELIIVDKQCCSKLDQCSGTEQSARALEYLTNPSRETVLITATCGRGILLFPDKKDPSTDEKFWTTSDALLDTYSTFLFSWVLDFSIHWIAFGYV